VVLLVLAPWLGVIGFIGYAATLLMLYVRTCRSGRTCRRPAGDGDRLGVQLKRAGADREMLRRSRARGEVRLLVAERGSSSCAGAGEILIAAFLIAS